MNPFGLRAHQLAAFACPVLEYLPAGYGAEDADQAEIDDVGSLAALASPDVVEARAEAYRSAGVHGFTFWEQPGPDLSPAENWATVMAGSLSLDPPIRGWSWLFVGGSRGFGFGHGGLPASLPVAFHCVFLFGPLSGGERGSMALAAGRGRW